MKFAWILSIMMMLGGTEIMAQTPGGEKPGNFNPSSMPKYGYLSGTLIDKTTGEGIDFVI